MVSFKVGEPGEFVGIIQQHHPVREFTGYSDRSVRIYPKCCVLDFQLFLKLRLQCILGRNATEKKILRNVWSKGDLCFRSGDILVIDVIQALENLFRSIRDNCL